MNEKRNKLDRGVQTAPPPHSNDDVTGGAKISGWMRVVCLPLIAVACFFASGVSQSQAFDGSRFQSQKDESLFSSIFNGDQSQAGFENWKTTALTVTLRFALASLLAALLAFRPQKRIPIAQRNPYVAQTQILLAVVASALMMVVADNAARAFGIFAAASLVRFRTNIRDPKEITVLLASLGIGLATGVGKWELAIILSLFVLLLLWVMESFEPEQILRALELKVRTHDVDGTQETLKRIFERYRFTAEVRELDRPDESNSLGKIVYFVNIHPSLSTDRLSEEIFASDPQNIDSVEWHQKKSLSYMYR